MVGEVNDACFRRMQVFMTRFPLRQENSGSSGPRRPKKIRDGHSIQQNIISTNREKAQTDTEQTGDGNYFWTALYELFDTYV